MSKVLFVTYGGGHGTMTLPVTREVAKHGHECHVYALTNASLLFQHNDVPFYSYINLLSQGDHVARRWGEALATRFHNPDSGIPREETVAYLGLSMQDLVEKYGEVEAEARFQAEGRHAFYQTTVMRRAIDRHHPDIVVTTNSPRSERAAVQVANEMGIPTLSMNDLFGFNFKPMLARHITALCQEAVDRLRQNGAKADHYYVTGNPAFDSLLSGRDVYQQQSCRRDLGIGERQRVTVFIDQPAYWNLATLELHRRTPEEISADLDEVLEGCRAGGSLLLIRPHPSQPHAFYRQWMADKDCSDVSLVAGAPLHPLLAAADLIVSHTSTVMLEALYLGTPVVQLQYQPGESDMPLGKIGAASISRRRQDTPAVVAKALEGGGQAADQLSAFRAAFPFEPAAPRIASIIHSIVRGT